MNYARKVSVIFLFTLVLVFQLFPDNAYARPGEFQVIRYHYDEKHPERKMAWVNAHELEKRLMHNGISIPFSLFQEAAYPEIYFYPSVCNQEFPGIAEKVVHLRYSDLIYGLEVVLPRFVERIGKEKYSVGLHPGKSSTWVAALALEINETNHLNLPIPTSSWVHALDDSAGGIFGAKNYPRSIDDAKENNFVLFDDVSYTGSQLEHIVVNALRSLQARPTAEMINIFLCIPFVSAGAIKRVEKSLRDSIPKNISIDLLTTDKELPTDDLFQSVLPWVSPPVLVFADWKIPDEHSFPEELIKCIRPNHLRPPYSVARIDE